LRWNIGISRLTIRFTVGLDAELREALEDRSRGIDNESMRQVKSNAIRRRFQKVERDEERVEADWLESAWSAVPPYRLLLDFFAEREAISLKDIDRLCKAVDPSLDSVLVAAIRTELEDRSANASRTMRYSPLDSFRLPSA
jgi:hypothetical protein